MSGTSKVNVESLNQEIQFLTFGTTSLNHGFGDSSSANHSAVAEPISLERLCISHSALVRRLPRDGRHYCYLGNVLQLRDGFAPDLLMGPRCSYPTQQPLYHEPIHWNYQRVFAAIPRSLTAYSSLQPKEKHIRCHNHRAYVLLRQRSCSLFS